MLTLKLRQVLTCCQRTGEEEGDVADVVREYEQEEAEVGVEEAEVVVVKKAALVEMDYKLLVEGGGATEDEEKEEEALMKKRKDR